MGMRLFKFNSISTELNIVEGVKNYINSEAWSLDSCAHHFPLDLSSAYHIFKQ